MQLLTQELEARFRQVGSQENNPDPLVIVRYFNPGGAGTWYATEYDPDTKLFFGYASILGGDCDEWGYFSLNELQQPLPFKMVINGKEINGNGFIERDLYFSEKPISEALKQDGLTYK
jgi:hypothetical protein